LAIVFGKMSVRIQEFVHKGKTIKKQANHFFPQQPAVNNQQRLPNVPLTPSKQTPYTTMSPFVA